MIVISGVNLALLRRHKMGKHKDKKLKLETKDEPPSDTEGNEVKNAIPTESVQNGRQPLPAPSTEKDEYEALCRHTNEIAHPMANRKVAKKVYKLIKKSAKVKFYCRQGIVDVQRALRKSEKGVVVLAGDVTPVDIYAHVPGMCEELGLPYCYTPSKAHLGLATGHRRPTIMCLIREHADYKDLYDEVYQLVDQLTIPR